MTVTYFREDAIPSFICLSTDVNPATGAVAGIPVIGAKVFFTDTGTHWIVGSDLKLVPYAESTTGGASGSAGTSAIQQVILTTGSAVSNRTMVPTFSGSDIIIRPPNTTSYATGKSINSAIPVTTGCYTGNNVTLMAVNAPLSIGDRITVGGVNTAYTWTNVDGNWVVSSVSGSAFSFTTASAPTGTAYVSATAGSAIAKMMSIPVADTNGTGIILSRVSVTASGSGMTGAIRVYVYCTQVTALTDQSTFTLLQANDNCRRDYFDLYPITEGAGSDVTFASQRLWEVFHCDSNDNRLYFRLASEGASIPISSGSIILRVSGIQLLG